MNLRWHPIIVGLASGALFFAVVVALLAVVPPAWALSIPVGNLFVVDLGDLAPWVSIFVAFLVYRRQVKLDQKVANVDVKIDGMLVDRDAENVKKGEEKEKLVGDRIAEGVAKERATSAAAVPAPVADGKPLPVVDEHVAGILERSATALERTAAATEEKKS